MKFFKKKGVAIAVMVLAIVLSSAYGIYKRPDVTVPEGGEKLDESLSTAVFEQYVVCLLYTSFRVGVKMPAQSNYIVQLALCLFPEIHAFSFPSPFPFLCSRT